MKCINCQKEFDAKRESAKYCSANCRVKWNYKKEKRVKKESLVQMQTVMNTILEMVGKINQQQVPEYRPTETSQKPMFPPRLKIKRSYENYQQLKIECETVEEWLALKAEILDSDLPSAQKKLLTS